MRCMQAFLHSRKQWPDADVCGRSVIATKNSPASIDAGRTRLSSHVEAARSPASDSNSVSLFLRVVVDVADVASLLEIGRAAYPQIMNTGSSPVFSNPW